jgi:hypothetical protein
MRSVFTMELDVLPPPIIDLEDLGLDRGAHLLNVQGAPPPMRRYPDRERAGASRRAVRWSKPAVRPCTSTSKKRTWSGPNWRRVCTPRPPLINGTRPSPSIGRRPSTCRQRSKLPWCR